MADKKVKLKDQLGRVVRLDSGDAGATLGKNLFGPDGKLLTAAQIINPPASQQNAVPTLWKLIREIPANVQKLAALVGKGFAVRRDDGEWALRTLQEGTGIDIGNPDGEAGNPTIGLEDLPDSGAGALIAITRDAKGRVSGTRAATTTDLAEGTNLYFTAARADARIAAQKGQPNGVVPLGADSLIPTAYLPPLALTDVAVVNSQAAQLALVAQEGDVAVRTDISKNYIHNGGTAGTMADWTELLTPAAPVQSVNGQTGNVTLAAADVGAATAAQGAKADSALQSIVPGTGITVNNADPRNPVVSASGQAGTFASRPSATSVPAGTIYFATDAREEYISNGAAWVLLPSGGNELGYAERTSDYSVAAGTTTDVPGLSVTSVVGMGDVSVNFGGTMVMAMTTAGEYANLILYVDGVYTAQLLARAVGDYIVVSRNCRLTGFTPGTPHTFKIGLQSVGGAAATLAGRSEDRPYIQVVTL
ncbi:hypothetical protein [Stenotrophomonas sp.]|uniref:hypothetical protein n=1 Tax=Stenotrophomonas sp. TaxID=69392 RepID=UPI00289C3CEF|nr:hypothetical protein [Stenotrophomonas sp.]